MMGFDPVVLAATASPDSLKEAAISRATLDFPLVPVTQIRSGIYWILLAISKRSYNKYKIRITIPAPETASSLISSLPEY